MVTPDYSGLRWRQDGAKGRGERHGVNPCTAMATGDLDVGRSGRHMARSGEMRSSDMERRSGSRLARPSMTLRHESVGIKQA